MDQIKQQLAVAMKHGFWIGSVLVLLCSCWFWYSATSSLQQESTSQISGIKAAISTVSGIRNKLSDHPNSLSHAEMQLLIEDRQDQVLRSWESLYNRQRDLLVWPEEDLTKKLVDEFRGKIPIETHVEYPTPEGDELTTSLRDRYASHISKALPDIAAAGGTKWTAVFDSKGAQGGGRGMTPMGGSERRGEPRISITGAEEGPLVKWSGSSQTMLLEDLFPWRPGLPTTLDIYYSQENLWVLQQLLEIVADVNGAAKQPYQAKIHRINTIAIGRSVQFGAGEIAPPGSRAGAGMMGGPDMMGSSMMGGPDMGGSMMGGGMMGGGMNTVSPDPADNRYVTEALKPIKATSLRAALKNDSPSDVSLAIAKRLPVMMSLQMNQRSIPKLLAACGSARLMVDVRQTRILPQGKSSSAGLGGSMGGEGMMGSGGSMGGMGGATVTVQKNTDEFPLDMKVEIYGLIYIYNPQAREKLGLEQITQETVAEAVQSLSGEAKPDEPAVATPDDDSADGEDSNDVLPTPDAAPAAEAPEAGSDPPTDAPSPDNPAAADAP